MCTPIVLACTAYFVLWKKERSRQMPRQGQEARDVKLITGVFLVTWLPVEFLIVVLNLCISCRNISPFVVYVIKLLQYGNSVANIVIYPARNVDFRSALVDMLCPCKCPCRNHQVDLTANGEVSVISSMTIDDVPCVHVQPTSFQQTSSL